MSGQSEKVVVYGFFSFERPYETGAQDAFQVDPAVYLIEKFRSVLASRL